MRRISSYDSDALLPKLGTRWVWEIDSPHARELIEVVEVRWNGEEWWVRTKSLLTDAAHLPSLSGSNEALNDLSRFWEAVTPVGGGTYGLTERRPQRGAIPA
jgi:hypothetical protein